MKRSFNSIFESSLQNGNDQKYMNLANKVISGDVSVATELWNMVSAAAKVNGYDVGPVYHGSADGGITSFDVGKSGNVQTGDWGKGIYFTPSRRSADHYRREALRVFDKESNRLFDEFENRAKEMGTSVMGMGIDLGWGSEKYRELSKYEDRWRKRLKEIDQSNDGCVYMVFLRLDNPMVYEYVGITDPYLSKYAIEHGHDGIIIVGEQPAAGKKIEEYAQEILVFDPSQIKSAKLIVLDDEGKVIPLSRRFNAKSRDIRESTHTLEQKFIAAKQKLEWAKNEAREGRLDWDAVTDYRGLFRNAEFAYENNGAIPMTRESEREYLADMHELERKNKMFKSNWGYENSIRKGDKIGDNQIGGKFKIEVGGYLFRGVTIEDWNRIQRQGYIDTDGRGAIVPEEEGINLGSHVSSAFSYIPAGTTGVILAIDPSDLDLYAIGADDYPRAAGRIPLKNVVKASKPISKTKDGIAFIPV